MEPALPFLGKGVYRIKIILKEPTEHLGLKLSRTNMAKKIVIIDASGHETVVFDTGKTDMMELSVVNMHLPIIVLPKLDTESELIITLNNSKSLHGGFEAAPILGSVNGLVLNEQYFKFIAVAMACILALFTFLNIFIGWLRGRDKAQLMLGLLTLPFALRQLSVSGVLYDIFPNLTNSIDSAIGWGTFFAPIIFGFSYFRTSFPNLVPRWLSYIVYTATAVGIAIFILFPLYYAQMYGVYYRPIVLVALLIMIGLLVNGLKNPTPELKYTILSSSILIFLVILDILFFIIFEYSSIFSVAAFGMVIFVGMQTVLISKRYLGSLQQAAKLGEDMRVLNSNLEKTVKERTAELAQKNLQLEQIAKTDVLTGLANRREFDEVITKEVARGQRNEKTLVIAMLDIDMFKVVNDTHGHNVGDVVLKDIAKLLTDNLRAGDFAARWGGEEFCILFPETEGEQAYKVCERIKQNIEDHVSVSGKIKLSVTVSIGLAIWRSDKNTDEHLKDIDEVLKDADKALYDAKNAGRNKIIAYWH